MQNVAEQLLATGPPVPEILQWPNTASSGRKLIAVNCGGSYRFFSSLWLTSMSILIAYAVTQPAAQLPHPPATLPLFKI
jgi:hypothetical protein